MPGQKKCLGVNCSTCPYIEPRKTVKCHISGASVDINAAVNCQTENVIYCISCNRCSEVYVGQTSKSLSQRFSQHLGYIRNFHNHTAAGKRIEPTGQHFNGPGHQGIQLLKKFTAKVGQYEKKGSPCTLDFSMQLKRVLTKKNC